MNFKKMSVIFAVSVLMGACNGNTYAKADENTTYGIENNKWAVMSSDQKKSAKEVYRLEQSRLAAQSKLNRLHDKKATADVQRETQHKEELSRIERENFDIRDQERRVSSITENERLRQKQREHDLDSLKN